MGFFKKKEISPEEQATLDAQKAEKIRLKQEKADEREKQKAIQQAAEDAKVKRFFGNNPGFDERNNYTIYRPALERIQSNFIQKDETILATVIAEFKAPNKKEVKGVLVATDNKLVFSSNTLTKEINKVIDYKSLTDISLSSDGFLKKELHLISSKSKTVFDDIKDNKHLEKLMRNLRRQISSAHAGTDTKGSGPVIVQSDKYEQLERIANLREKGILSEEEFNIEKSKLLGQ